MVFSSLSSTRLSTLLLRSRILQWNENLRVCNASMSSGPVWFRWGMHVSLLDENSCLQETEDACTGRISTTDQPRFWDLLQVILWTSCRLLWTSCRLLQIACHFLWTLCLSGNARWYCIFPLFSLSLSLSLVFIPFTLYPTDTFPLYYYY